VSKLDKKPKKGVAVVISIGPKMKTKPTDAATPEMPMKKYGSMPMKKAMEVLKQRGKYVPTTAESEYVATNSENRHHPMSNREKDEAWKEEQLDGSYDEGYYPDDETPIWDDDRQPIGKPEFGNEGAREAEMNQAERAAIMAEGMPEMQRPRSAPRPGDPRFSFADTMADPNKPRPSMPRDIFQNRR